MSIDLLNGGVSAVLELTGRDLEGGGGAVRLALARGWRSGMQRGKMGSFPYGNKTIIRPLRPLKRAYLSTT
jgi:hypothetical protein